MSHCSTWPPSAAVRQISIAVITRRCAVDEDPPCPLTIDVAVAAEHVRHFGSPTGYPFCPTAQAGDGSVCLERMGIGHGSRSNGLVVAQTLLVAIRRYIAVVLRLLATSTLNGPEGQSRIPANALRRRVGANVASLVWTGLNGRAPPDKPIRLRQG